MYMLLHGVNYYRPTISEIIGMKTGELTADELRDIVYDLAQKASAEREGLSENETGEMQLSKSLLKTLSQAGEGYRVLDDIYPPLWGVVNRAKPVMLSHYMSYSHIIGIYSPFTVETNVDVDINHCDIPATAAHEVAHSRGFAREDECNFLAWLSCINHPSADYRYSGYILAFIYCSGDLYDYDRDMYTEAIKPLSEAVRRDLKARSEYWKQFDTPTGQKVQKVADRANDKFIESQGVKEGSLSYGMMVSLVADYYRNNTEK